VNPVEFALTSVLVVLVAGLSGYFGWRQWGTLRRLRAEPDLPAEERCYLHNQAWRRLVCCALLLVIAGFLVGWFFLEADYRAIRAQAQERAERKEDKELTADQQRFLRFFTFYWGVALGLLLVVLSLAALDLWAIARFGLHKHRQLQADHRALMEEHAARLRSRRNGHQ
jgi:hypothetical protein